MQEFSATGNQRLSLEGPVRISVVVPTFRRPQLLQRCLEALCTQLLPPESYEVIVVTDGPDAATTLLVSRLQPLVRPGKLQLYSLMKKAGPAAARNLGWKKACGRWIVFTDDDCVPDGRMLERYLDAFRICPDFAFTGRVRVPLQGLPTDYERNISRLETAGFITANCGVPRRIMKELGGFDESFPGAWREDSELHFNLLSRQIPIGRIADAVVWHPVRPAPWGVSLREEKKNQVNALLFKKYPGLYRRHIAAQPTWNYYLMLGCFLAGTCLALSGQKTTGFVFLAVWLLMTARFSFKRLRGASRDPKHILEMLITSLLIPFVSFYWSLYGAIKYKVLFLT